MVHSNDLQSAAEDYFSTDGEPELLAERVEAHTEWDGEINEIVHITRRGVAGKDVLMQIMLSDNIRSDNNKKIIFYEHFKYLGVKIGINTKGEY